MARAQEPKPRVGGAMAPEAIALAGRGRELAENRLLEAMRQAGATERGKMQAQAQVQTAQVGAGSRQQIAAMQIAEADRRAAERIRGAELDREFAEKMTRLNDFLVSKREKEVYERERAERESRWEDYEKWQSETEATNAAIRIRDNMVKEQTNQILYRMLGRSIEGMADAEKVVKAERDKLRTATQNEAANNIIRKEVADRREMLREFPPGAEVRTSPHSYLENEFKELEITKEIMPKDLDSRDKSKTERLIADGKLKHGDIRKLAILLEEYREWGRKTADEVRRKKVGFAKDLRQSRLKRLASFQRMHDHLLDLKDSTRMMNDGSESVGSYVKKALAAVDTRVETDQLAVMERMTDSPQEMKRYLENIKRIGTDWDSILGSPTTQKLMGGRVHKKLLEMKDVWEMSSIPGFGEQTVEWGAD